MGKGFAKKKKQARMMQEQMAKMHEELKHTEITGVAANGLVSITLTGESEVKSVSIKPECVDPEDIEGLEDLIKVAFNDAQNKLQKASPMSGLLEGGGFPDLSGFGF